MAIELVIPMLGVTVEKGRIVEWLKREGDSVEKGESVFVVEADKVTTEVEAPASGILAKILLPEGEEVPVLTVVGLIVEAGEDLSEGLTARRRSPASPAHDSAPGMPAEAAFARPSGDPTAPLRAVPAARKLAAEHGIELEKIGGSGPEGVICVHDVQRAVAAAAQKTSARIVSSLGRQSAEKLGVPLEEVQGTGVRGRIMRGDVELEAARRAKPALGKVIAMSGMRQTIARRMSESAFSAPHIFVFTDVCMDALLAYRKELLPEFERSFSLRLSINDLLIKAVALNLAAFPLLNATVKGSEIHVLGEVNIGLAVALDEGLIVPAVRGADQAGLTEIARQRTDLVERARKGKLTREETERGTFTISSMAQYDITHFAAILNPPQSGILSVGKVRDELYLEDGTVRSRKVASLGLSADHRIVDGALAADFLQHLKWKLEKPLFTFSHL